MSDWYYPASAEQLEVIDKAAGDFRGLWNKIRPPFSTAFEGEMSDVAAMDYIEYEGIGEPKCGIDGAALVWGEVLRKTFGMQWVVSYRGDYMIVFPEDIYPRMVIWPFARLLEVRLGSSPNLPKYGWGMERVILDVILTVGLSEEQETRLSQVIQEIDNGFLNRVVEDGQAFESVRRILKLSRPK